MELAKRARTDVNDVAFGTHLSAVIARMKHRSSVVIASTQSQPESGLQMPTTLKKPRTVFISAVHPRYALMLTYCH